MRIISPLGQPAGGTHLNPQEVRRARLQEMQYIMKILGADVISPFFGDSFKASDCRQLAGRARFIAQDGRRYAEERPFQQRNARGDEGQGGTSVVSTYSLNVQSPGSEVGDGRARVDRCPSGTQPSTNPVNVCAFSGF